MRVLAAGRQGGKTTQVVDWLKAGERTETYPGWTRVLLVSRMSEFNRLRARYWGEIEDFDHRVYHVRDWARGYRVDPATEVVIDNIEFVLPHLPGRLAAFTVTGEPWT